MSGSRFKTENNEYDAQRSVSCLSLILTLTHHVEVEIVALAISLGIVAYTGVVTSAVSTDTLQHQALIADDNSSRHIVAQQMAL